MNEIANLIKQRLIDDLNDRKKDLRRDSGGIPDVHGLRKKGLASIDEELAKVNENYVLTPNNMPGSETFLLQILIIQNQRIIELLEQKR